MSVDQGLHTFRSSDFRSVVIEAVDFFNDTPVHPFPPSGSFAGTGVYALYYVGRYELYRSISTKNKPSCSVPIYVGKAVPSGWRTGRRLTIRKRDLYNRLKQHARSVKQAKNLSPGEFRVRFMLLEDVESDLIIPVEAELIRIFEPLWNCVVDGFGNHDPGRGRYNQAKSEWDVLHPGRPWAARLKGESTSFENIVEKVRRYV